MKYAEFEGKREGNRLIFRRFNIPKVQKSEGPKVRRSKSPKIEKLEGPKFRRSKIPKVQKSEGSKIRRVKSPKVQRSEGSKVRRLKSPKFPWVIGGGGGMGEGGGMGGCGGYITEIMFSIHKFFSISKSKEFNGTQQTTTCYKTFLVGLSENVTHKTYQESF